MLVILPPPWLDRAPSRMADYYLINVVCMPLASTVAVSRMILGGVSERFPDLRMLVVHGGGYLPFYFARTDHAYKVRPEARRHLPRPPQRVLARARLRHHGLLHRSAVEYLVGEFGADHVLMGTDYPFDMGPPDPLGFLADANLTEEEHALVVGGNAAQLLRIPTR